LGLPDLMDVFHQAGIRTSMITGDQSATARAVGQSVGISDREPLDLLDSRKLEKADTETLRRLVQDVSVFSTVTPAHKLEIVRALQRAGFVVAMTGDGVNDGPALRAADVGVAMGGGRSTEVARMTADVVLEDDNLRTMIVAIRQGRAIYGNTQNAIRYLLATNISEILVTLGAVGAGVGQPLSPMQLLWINLVSDIFPVLALATQPPESDVLKQPPRDPQEPFLKARDLRQMAVQSAVITAGSLASYAWGVLRYGAGPAASTMAFSSLTTAQILHMLSARSQSESFFTLSRPPINKTVAAAVLGGLGLQLVGTFVPPLRRLLGIVPIGPVDVLVSALGAVVPLLVNEGIKSLPAPRRTPRVGRADEGSDVKGLEDAAEEPAGSLLQPAKDDLLDPSMQRSEPQLATL
jgi:Ca2+-transporting ATPase